VHLVWRVGWFSSRGYGAGPFLVLIAIVAIAWNEKIAIDTYNDIQDDKGRVVEVKCGTDYDDMQPTGM